MIGKLPDWKFVEWVVSNGWNVAKRKVPMLGKEHRLSSWKREIERGFRGAKPEVSLFDFTVWRNHSPRLSHRKDPMKFRLSVVCVAVLSAASMIASAADEKKPAAAPAAKGDDLSQATSLFRSPFPPAPVIDPTGVIANVNGKVIVGSDLEKEVQNLQMQASRRMPPEQIAQMLPRIQQQAVMDLVNKQLLVEAVASRKITVGDDEIKKAIDDLLKNAPPGQTLEDALKQANMTMKQFTQQMAEGLSIQKLMNEEMKNVNVTDEDLKKYYEKNPDQFKRPETVSARHILIKSDAGDDAAKKESAKKKADGVRARLVKGEDFAKVCAEVSDDPGSKNNGGLYENFPRGQMVPPFENAAFTQKAGEIGPLVETQFGYHIIKVEKHNEAGKIDLAEVKDRLKMFLENQKKSETAQKYLKTLRDAAKITFADGFAPPAESAAPASTTK